MRTEHARPNATVCRLLATIAVVAGTIAVVGRATTALAAPPVAVATVTSPASNPLLGESSTFAVTFDNTDTTATGYSPYLDIRINTAGADGAGAATDDGLLLATMSFLGSPVAAAAPGVLCNGVNVTHPLTGLAVVCPAGQQLFVFQLPFGSFTPNQPVAVLDTTVTMSNLADVGFALSLSATPGFAFGNSPTGAAPIMGTTVTATTTPQIARITKTYQGPENETATGPNFTQAYVVVADLPNAIVFSSVQIKDLLPNTHQFKSVDSLSPAGSVATSVPSTAVPGGSLIRTWGPITGGSGPTDASVRYSFHVPLLDGGGAMVLSATTGDDVNTVNNSSLVVTYTPVDARDSVATTTIDPNTADNHTLIAKSIAIQTTSTFTNPAGSSPAFHAGDTITYAIAGQVSDYFSSGGIVLTDILGDGQTFVPGSATYTSTSEGVTTPAPPALPASFNAGDLTADQSARTTCGNGTTTLVLRLSDALARAGASPMLVGGLVHAAPNRGAATFQITFQALVSDAYACLAGDKSIDEGDRIDNNVTVHADLYSPTATALGTSEDDASATTRPIDAASVTTTMYAKNGVIGAFTTVSAGDLVTYRIQTTSPSSDFELLTLTDFLPLPVFSSGTFSTATVTTTCAMPAADQACYGPADTLHNNGAAPDPAVIVDTVSNSIRFNYGTFDDPANNPTTLDLLLSVRVTNAAFRDGLLFSNEVLKQFNNSFAETTTSSTIAQLTLTEPLLDIVKGVASAGNAHINGLADPTSRNPTGVIWFDPGVAAVTPGFSGIVTTTGLAVGAPNADATNADAADIVRFAIVVENTGAGVNGAFDVTINDTFPNGFIIPAAGIRLLVTNGAGTTLPNSATGAFVAGPGTGGDQTGTITLTDGVTGSLAPGKTGNVVNTAGTNIAVVTYELEVAATAVPHTVHTNTTNLTGFSGSAGGPNFIGLVTAAKATNLAKVTTARVVPFKEVVASDQASTDGDRLAIGEVVTYRTVLTIPEGTSQTLVALDTLDVGQAMVSVDSVTATAALTTTISGGFATVLANAQAGLASPGRTMTLAFGDVTNSDRDNTVAETITIVYRAIVLNVAGNTINLNKNNSVNVTYTGDSGAAALAAVTIVEPVLITDKSATPTTADAMDVVTFVIDVRHTAVLSDADAFDVTTVDDIPSGMTYVAGSLGNVIGGSNTPTTTLGIVGTTITATWSSLTLAPFEFGQITYQATLDADTAAPATITNTATTQWTSLPPTHGSSPYNVDGAERTGTGGVNSYHQADSVTVSVANPQLIKSLAATDDATTTGSNVTIGETVTYQLLVTLPEWAITGLQVRDVLPDGLRYEPASATVITDAALSGGELPNTFNGTLGTPTFSISTAGTTDTLTVDVDATTVTSDNIATNNSFLIRFDGIVADVSGNIGFGPNTVLDNTATVQLDGGSVVASNTVGANVVEPHLVVVKSFSPNGATPGSNVAVTITVQNDGLSDGYESVLTDTLDARFDATTVVSTSVPSGWTFSQSGADLTWTANAGVATAAGFTLAFVFTVDVLASNPSGAAIPNTASVVTTNHVDVVAGERSEPAQTGLGILGVVSADLMVTKTDGMPNAAPGATLNYVVVTSNSGGAPASNVVLTDTLPPGTTYVSVTGPCTLIGAPTATVTFTLGTIADGATVSCTITVHVTSPAAAGTTAYLNTVAADDDHSNGADPTPANNTTTDSDTIAGAHPDLNVTKDDGVTSLVPGAATSYLVTVTNTGNIGASNVHVTDTLPAGFVFGSCTQVTGTYATPCTNSGGVVSTTITTLAGGGASATFMIAGTIVSPAPAGLNTVSNIAGATDDGINGTDLTPADNTSTADVDTIDAVPDLVIAKSSLDPAAAAGGTVRYSLTASNASGVKAQAATGFIVSDPFPPGLTAVCGSEVPLATTCTVAGYTWTAATFAVGASQTYLYTLHVSGTIPSGSNTVINTATVGDDASNGPDPTPGNNTATASVTLTGFDVVVDNTVDLAIENSNGATTSTPGTFTTWQLTIANHGAVATSHFIVIDVLPTQLSQVTYEPAAGSYDTATGVWSGPAVAVGATLTIALSGLIAADATGALVNEATVALLDGLVDPTPNDNHATDTDALVAVSPVSIMKSAAAPTTMLGSAMAFTITVSNAGPSVATHVSLLDAMPATLSLAGVIDSGGWTCTTAGTESVSCDLNQGLAPATSVSMRLEATTLAAGEARNVAIVNFFSSGVAQSSSAVAVIDVIAPAPPVELIPATGAGVVRLVLPAVWLIVVGAILVLAVRRQQVKRRGHAGASMT